MWISARTATTLAAAALLLVMVAVAAPLMPRPHLPSLPEERRATSPSKFGAATDAIDRPERVRAQRMVAADAVPKGAAHWEGCVGSGAATQPAPSDVQRLTALVKDARTVAQSDAKGIRPSWVVRFVRDEHRVDVMVDDDRARVAVVLDGRPVGTYAIDGLRREFASLGDALLPEKP